MSLQDTKKLAFFYGWPSTVENAGGDVNLAAAVYKDYDQVVFGQGIEDPAHPDHANTVAIIAHPDLANTDVFGYVDATIAYEDVYQAVDRWEAMGVAGIFYDQFGYDFNVSRERQNSLVDYVQYKGLQGFVNAWNVDDVFASTIDANMNPTGLAPVIGPNDWYLSESFQIINGGYQTAANWQTKTEKMINYRTTFGTKMAATTTYDASPYDQAKMDYAYFSALIYGLDSFSWGEQFFAAGNSLLPFRPRKEFYGTKHVNGVTINAGVYERNTNIGFVIDTVNHTVDTLTP